MLCSICRKTIECIQKGASQELQLLPSNLARVLLNSLMSGLPVLFLSSVSFSFYVLSRLSGTIHMQYNLTTVQLDDFSAFRVSLVKGVRGPEVRGSSFHYMPVPPGAKTYISQ